jgi:hypothetical protein
MTTIRAASSSAAALLAAAAAGVAAGGLTAYLQGVLSANWNTVANSGAVWTVMSFVVAGLVGRTRLTAAAAGTLVLVGEVAGYYSYVADVRHLPLLESAELLWLLAALWIGPLAGLAAFAAWWGPACSRARALCALSGVAIGEGSYLARLAGVPRAGWVEVVLGAAGIAGTLLAVPARVRTRLAALGIGGIVAVGVYAAYAQPLIT